MGGHKAVNPALKHYLENLSKQVGMLVLEVVVVVVEDK